MKQLEDTMVEKLPRLQSEQQAVILDAKVKLLAIGVSEDHREVIFLTDMHRRLSRKKPLTPRQKAWILKIINRGDPDSELLGRIDAILEDDCVSDHHDMMASFRQRVAAGGSLTENQQNALERCETDLKDAKAGLRFTLSDEHQKTLSDCEIIFRARYWYFSRRPGTYRMVDDILQRWQTRGHLSRGQYEAVVRVFKNMMKPLTDPDYPKGEMAKILAGYHRKADGASYYLATEVLGLAVENPKIATDGGITQKFLVDGQLIHVDVKSLRRPWRRARKSSKPQEHK
ncbi:MAG: hypothetical protein ACW96N_00025 [Candidatus Thorarchaeota archaeon]|jgi:hypothetical protein